MQKDATLWDLSGRCWQSGRNLNKCFSLQCFHVTSCSQFRNILTWKRWVWLATLHLTHPVLGCICSSFPLSYPMESLAIFFATCQQSLHPRYMHTLLLWLWTSYPEREKKYMWIPETKAKNYNHPKPAHKAPHFSGQRLPNVHVSLKPLR